MTEQTLHNIITECISKVLTEGADKYYKWCVGKDYYLIRGYFQKRGYHVSDEFWYDNDEKTSGGVKMVNGYDYVRITTTIKRNPNTGNLNCDKVTSVYEHIDD